MYCAIKILSITFCIIGYPLSPHLLVILTHWCCIKLHIPSTTQDLLCQLSSMVGISLSLLLALFLSHAPSPIH